MPEHDQTRESEQDSATSCVTEMMVNGNVSFRFKPAGWEGKRMYFLNTNWPRGHNAVFILVSLSI